MGGGEWSAQRGDPVLKVLIYCVPLLSSKENHTFFLKKKKKKGVLCFDPPLGTPS